VLLLAAGRLRAAVFLRAVFLAAAMLPLPSIRSRTPSA
jgi:hypothetical protein